MKRASKKGKTFELSPLKINRELFIKIFLHTVLLLLSRTGVSCGVISVDHQLDGRGCQFKIS